MARASPLAACGLQRKNIPFGTSDLADPIAIIVAWTKTVQNCQMSHRKYRDYLCVRSECFGVDSLKYSRKIPYSLVLLRFYSNLFIRFLMSKRRNWAFSCRFSGLIQ